MCLFGSLANAQVVMDWIVVPDQRSVVEGESEVSFRSASLQASITYREFFTGSDAAYHEVSSRITIDDRIIIVDHALIPRSGRLEVSVQRVRQSRRYRIVQRDLEVFGRVYETLPEGAPEAIFSLFNYLRSAPAGSQINYAETIGASDWTSLCGHHGDAVSATFVGRSGRERVTQETLGDCFDRATCLGRCGAGCTGSPGDRVQRFTQECLNHDVCTRETGRILGPCVEEFLIATPGFFAAPNCASLSGRWRWNDWHPESVGTNQYFSLFIDADNRGRSQGRMNYSLGHWIEPPPFVQCSWRGRINLRPRGRLTSGLAVVSTEQFSCFDFFAEGRLSSCTTISLVVPYCSERNCQSAPSVEIELQRSDPTCPPCPWPGTCPECSLHARD